MNKPDLKLYFITDSTGLALPQLTAIVDKACKGGATIIQLREKDKTTREYLELALAVKSVTDLYNIPLVIDDRVDIALASNVVRWASSHIIKSTSRP